MYLRYFIKRFMFGGNKVLTDDIFKNFAEIEKLSNSINEKVNLFKVKHDFYLRKIGAIKEKKYEDKTNSAINKQEEYIKVNIDFILLDLLQYNELLAKLMSGIKKTAFKMVNTSEIREFDTSLETQKYLDQQNQLIAFLKIIDWHLSSVNLNDLSDVHKKIEVLKIDIEDFLKSHAKHIALQDSLVKRLKSMVSEIKRNTLIVKDSKNKEFRYCTFYNKSQLLKLNFLCILACSEEGNEIITRSSIGYKLEPDKDFKIEHYNLMLATGSKNRKDTNIHVVPHEHKNDLELFFRNNGYAA